MSENSARSKWKKGIGRKIFHGFVVKGSLFGNTDRLLD